LQIEQLDLLIPRITEDDILFLLPLDYDVWNNILGKLNLKKLLESLWGLEIQIPVGTNSGN